MGAREGGKAGVEEQWGEVGETHGVGKGEKSVYRKRSTRESLSQKNRPSQKGKNTSERYQLFRYCYKRIRSYLNEFLRYINNKVIKVINIVEDLHFPTRLQVAETAFK